MESIIIDRCIKKPGFIEGAKTYKLVLNENGLYIIEMGKAMGERVHHSGISGAIADKLIDKMEARREREIAGKQAELAQTDLDDLIKDKKNFLLNKESIDSIEFKEGIEPILKIKSKIKNITLHFHVDYTDDIKTIFNVLKQQ